RRTLSNRLFRRLHGRRDGDVRAAVSLGRELHGAFTKCEERVVAAEADIVSRMELRAALTDEDLAAADRLAAKALHAEAPAGGVATVAGRTACFLVSHDALLFLRLA